MDIVYLKISKTRLSFFRSIHIMASCQETEYAASL